MPQIELKYGKVTLPFDFDEAQFEVLGSSNMRTPMADLEIGTKFDQPIGSLPFDGIVNSGDTVLIVVPDATRSVGCGQVVNLIVRRLIACGVDAFDIRIIFATGIHRNVSQNEKSAILTPFIYQRIKCLDHGPRDLMQIVKLGEFSDGEVVELNRALVEHDHIIIIGGISFHYFAGFTGGRKLICPGLASTRTIAFTHKLAFDCETFDRRDGVGPGILDGNAVHESFVEAVSLIKPSFAVNTIVNDEGQIVDLFCGDWLTSHRAACDEYARAHTVQIAKKRDLVIASCGGIPHDVNMIQAHKALDSAARACNDGGTIVLLAECSEGMGRSDFLNWFEAADSRALAARLCDRYQVNGQTAFSLMQKTERFNVRVVTALPDSDLGKLRLVRAEPLSVEIKKAARASSGYIIPAGAKTKVDLI